ncbi:MAG TPA: condensation domain-containing protein, partial [Candidatus Deferrimicrobium sp.]|nr:condensation domain-containing protein [Candidatus Deferrimicrobium sp.]
SHLLPAYMIPSYFVTLTKIPLNANGKIDRKALPDPVRGEGIHFGDDADYTPPTTAIEEKLVAIWEKVLGRDKVGTHQNFFAIGGDSIKSIQIISRLGSAGYKLEMKDLFQYPVIAELAPHVTKLKRIPDQSVITGTIPLTPIQRTFFTESYSAPHHYNQAVMLYSPVRLDRGGIEAIFKKIQEHHDALRMTYEINKENGDVIQIDHEFDYPLALEEYEINGPAADIEPFAEKIQASIDLEKGPLLKLGLFHLKDGDRLLIIIHHLVIDGVSWRILFEDIETLHSQYKHGKKLTLPPKTDSFKTWAEKLSAYANSQALLKEKNYWQKIESTEAPLIIMKDFAVPDNYSTDNHSKDVRDISFTLSEEETKLLLTKVNEIFRTEINDILLTALAIGMKKTFGLDCDRVSIALEGHGREEIIEDLDISRTVGWFTVLYPVLLDVSYAGDMGRQIKEIKEILRRVPHKGIGYGILKYLTAEEYKKEIEFKLKPQLRFNYLGQFDADVKQLSSFEPAKETPGNSRGPNNRREYLLDVSGITANNRLTLTILYNQTHFKPGTMTAFAGHLQAELCQMITFCATKEKKEYSPSDFTYKGLTIESVNRLMELYPDAEDIYTLTPTQEGMLYHALVDESSYSYFEQMSYRLQGELDIDLVEKSFHELFKRHDILRTAFVYQDIERPVQLVLRERVIDFYYEDLSQSNEQEAKKSFVKEFKEKDKVRSFILSKDVLMRVAILKLENSEYEFTWSFHHILMDGWCTGILNNDFFEIYTSYLENRPYRLPRVKPYRTYIQWLQKQDKEESARYWENYLASFTEQTGVPKLKKSQAEASSYKNETVSVALTPGKTAGLHSLAGKNHVTLNTVTRAIWGVLLRKYNGKDDVVFGAVVSGRPFELEGVESMVGLFVNTIPVRIRFAENMKFYRLLQHIQQEAICSEPHHYNPLAEIQAQSSLGQNLIDHLFAFENYPIVEQIEGYEPRGNKTNPFSLKLTNVGLFEQTNYDFNVALSESAELKITFKYNGNVYDRDYVDRIAGHFLTAIERVIENEKLAIQNLEILSAEERKQILYDFNNTETLYPQDKSISQLFAEQAARTPDYVALVYKDQIMTYRELDGRANQLAHYLSEAKKVSIDEPVGVWMSQQLYRPVAVLAILKAGGAFVPLEPAIPVERIKYLINDARIGVVLSEKHLLRDLNRLQWECVHFHSYLCIDSPDIHAEEEEEINQLMDLELWQHVGESATDEITGGGWLSSYTGLPFSQEEMDEYGDNILTKLEPLLQPGMKVLEIGCASGISMYRLAPQVGLYYGTDLSNVIIEKNQKLVREKGIQNIELSCLPAHEIDRVPVKDFDLVIINSVIQCFHGHNYLRKVVQKAIALLGNKGYLFIGDVMDQEKKGALVKELTAFKEAHKHQGYTTKTDLSAELFVSPGFWHDLQVEGNEIEAVTCSDKLYTIENELTKFRYDVLVEVAKTKTKTGKISKLKYQDDLRALSRYVGLSQDLNILPGNLAYIIYTSGSTGRPKGVAVEHVQLVNFIYHMYNRYEREVGVHDRCLGITNFMFDVSIWEFFLPLTFGARLILLPDQKIFDFMALAQAILEKEITLIYLPPGLL